MHVSGLGYPSLWFFQTWNKGLTHTRSHTHTDITTHCNTYIIFALLFYCICFLHPRAFCYLLRLRSLCRIRPCVHSEVDGDGMGSCTQYIGLMLLHVSNGKKAKRRRHLTVLREMLRENYVHVMFSVYFIFGFFLRPIQSTCIGCMCFQSYVQCEC